jgi:outer membrane receptor protein involved in Fe transport
MDVNGNYSFSDRVSLGLQIANVFDDRHWEAFGGDVLRRRALTSLKYAW